MARCACSRTLRVVKCSCAAGRCAWPGAVGQAQCAAQGRREQLMSAACAAGDACCCAGGDDAQSAAVAGLIARWEKQRVTRGEEEWDGSTDVYKQKWSASVVTIQESLCAFIEQQRANGELCEGLVERLLACGWGNNKNPMCAEVRKVVGWSRSDMQAVQTQARVGSNHKKKVQARWINVRVSVGGAPTGEEGTTMAKRPTDVRSPDISPSKQTVAKKSKVDEHVNKDEQAVQHEQRSQHCTSCSYLSIFLR